MILKRFLSARRSSARISIYEGRNSKWHQDLIIHFASILRPKVYVEIGIHKCGLFNQMEPYCETLVGVDVNPESGRYMIRSERARFVVSRSSEFARQLRESPLSIDMLFIDGDHSETAVAADFDALFPFVSDHGIILLHDTHPLDFAATSQHRCGDAYKAIARLSKQADRYEMVTIPVHPGLTICRKRLTQLAWQGLEGCAAGRAGQGE